MVSSRCRHGGLVRRLAWTALSLVVARIRPAAAQANDPTDESLRQIERQRELRERLDSPSDVRLPRPAHPSLEIPHDETPCVKIDRIGLSGETRPPLAEVLGRALNRLDWKGGHCLGQRGIRIILREVRQQLIDAGLITSRVSAPPQDLDDGTLELAILPSRIDELRASPASDERARPAPAFPVRKGGLLDLRDLEQGLAPIRLAPTRPLRRSRRAQTTHQPRAPRSPKPACSRSSPTTPTPH